MMSPRCPLLRARRPWPPEDRRGALNYLTSAEVLAAIGEVRLGRTVSLEAPVVDRVTEDNPDPAKHPMTGTADDAKPSGVSFAMDRVEMNVHGNADSHMDALCHVIYDGTLYNGVPAGTVTDSQPTTCAPLHFPAQSNAEAFCPACLPIIPAISPEIRMAGCAPALKTSARGASNPNARLVVRICTTPLLLGSFPAKLTSNQYRVESPDRSEPTTARRNFPTPALPVPSNDAH